LSRLPAETNSTIEANGKSNHHQPKTNMRQNRKTDTFRFRAELTTDILTLIQIIPQRHITAVSWESNPDLPGAVATIRTALSVTMLMHYMGEIRDGHVMKETVALAADYTGERRYDAA